MKSNAKSLVNQAKCAICATLVLIVAKIVLIFLAQTFDLPWEDSRDNSKMEVEIPKWLCLQILGVLILINCCFIGVQYMVFSTFSQLYDGYVQAEKGLT